MSSDRPSRIDLRDRALSDLAVALGEQRAFLRRSVERALAGVVVGLADGLWDRLSWLHTQLLPDTCGEEFLGRWAAIYRVPRKDAETLADWRGRVLHRIGHPPRGGAQGDYAAWALEVSGVSRAWELPLLLGPGSVGVLFAAAASDGGYDAEATSGLRAQVQAALDAHKPLGGIRPVAVAPAPRALDLHLKLTPHTEAVQTAVATAVRQHLASLAPGTTVLWSQLRGVVSAAAGVTDHRLRSPTTDVPVSRCSLPVLGTVTCEAL